MADSKLTSYLLDQALLNYTLESTRTALSEGATQVAQKRARLALDFFISLLDPAVENERKHREVFQSELEALDKGKTAPISLPNLSRADGLSAAQSVLSLPDTLGEILSHISPLTVDGRSTFHSVSLVSRSFHQEADRTLWQTPHDLDTVEQQVKFAFGAAISSALSDSLGNQVKGLRIRRMPGGWNERLIVKIAELCPNVESLLLHCGDSEDGDDPATQSFVNTVHTVLSSLPNLKHLSLTKFSYTPPVTEDLIFSSDAYLPFTKLVSLRLYDFGWYWPAIVKGLGPTLKSLDLGLLPPLTSEQLISLAKLTSLTSINISSFIELEPLREFASKGVLERLHIKQFSEHDDKYAKEVVSIATENLPNLKALTLSGVEIGLSEFNVLTTFGGPLEEIAVQVQEGVPDEDCDSMITRLVNSKRNTLKIISVEFYGRFELTPSEQLVTALANCPLLEQILISFASPTALASTVVDSLLRRCKKLEYTWSLEALCQSNELYEKEYKAKLEREGEDQDVVLGN